MEYCLISAVKEHEKNKERKSKDYGKSKSKKKKKKKKRSKPGKVLFSFRRGNWFHYFVLPVTQFHTLKTGFFSYLVVLILLSG